MPSSSSSSSCYDLLNYKLHDPETWANDGMISEVCLASSFGADSRNSFVIASTTLGGHGLLCVLVTEKIRVLPEVSKKRKGDRVLISLRPHFLKNDPLHSSNILPFFSSTHFPCLCEVINDIKCHTAKLAGDNTL